MMDRPAWWLERKKDLEALPAGRAPLFVYNEETLNDLFFDFLAMEAIERHFYEVATNPYPGILKKAFDMGLSFLCRTPWELRAVMDSCSGITADRMMFVPGTGSAHPAIRPPGRGMTWALQGDGPIETYQEHLNQAPVLWAVSWGRDTLPRGAGEFSSRLHHVFDCIRAVGAVPAGLHLDKAGSGEARHILPGDVPAFLRDMGKARAEVSCLSFGPGAAEGILAQPGTGDREPDLEIMQDTFPAVGLWVTCPSGMFAPAGVLLLRITGVRAEGASRLLELGVDGSIDKVDPTVAPGPVDIVNLSQCDTPPAPFCGVLERRPDSGDLVCRIPSRKCAGPGDLLLIPDMGSARRIAPDCRIEETLLRARTICQVKIS